MRTLLIAVLALFVVAAAAANNNSPVVRLVAIDGSTRIGFTVYNPTNETMYVLKYGTPLENDLFANAFDIYSASGAVAVPYVGKLARRVWPPTFDSFAVIEPGRTASGSVDLIDHYAFPSEGVYTVNFHHTSLYAFDTFVAPLPIDITVTEQAVLARRNREVGEPQNTNCKSQELDQVAAAVQGAIHESRASYNCMAGGTCSNLATTWFGVYNPTNFNYDRDMFKAIYSRLTGYAFNAYCNPAGCGSNVYAYVYPTDTKYTVYLCGLFWKLPAERVNTVVHEMSHFRTLGGTDDYAYGKDACLNLAKKNPTQASHNADNVCYFSEAAAKL